MNTFLKLTNEEILNLYNNKKGKNLPKSTVKDINRAYWFKIFQAEGDFPKTDCYGDMVIMHHEGVCPQCGAGIIPENKGEPNPMGQYMSKATCRNGHTSYAEPSEDGFGDWVAY